VVVGDPRRHLSFFGFRVADRTDEPNRFGQNRETSTVRGAMHKLRQFSEFERYAKDRAREIKRSLSAIERRGAEGAVDRCRALADRISRNLRNKKLFGNNLSLLAELQVSIERAASVLDRIAALNHDQKGTLRKMNGLGRAQRRSNTAPAQKVQLGN
jgi:hypothetical protein